MSTQFRFTPLALALSIALFSGTQAYAQQSDTDTQQDAIEEVVTAATRLQGSAAAVVDERKNQAFVADIIGSEQLSRSGDSDAAAALRRVTGLTLDRKSTRLNSSHVRI